MRFNIAAEAALLVCSGGLKTRRSSLGLVQVGCTEGEGAHDSIALAAAHAGEGRRGMESVVLLLAQTTSTRSGAVADGNTNIVKFLGGKIEELRPATR
jgi:hypothetical protein